MPVLGGTLRETTVLISKNRKKANKIVEKFTPRAAWHNENNVGVRIRRPGIDPHSVTYSLGNLDHPIIISSLISKIGL